MLPRRDCVHLTDSNILKIKLEEERVHLIERVSALQAAQSERENAIERVQRDRKEQTTTIVRHVSTQRVTLTTS